MIEKNENRQQWHKKIMPYLDGSLSSEEHSQFEAYVRTHPEFQELIQVKMDELAVLRTLIPSASLSADSQDSLEREMKMSIDNLLKEEPKNLVEQVKQSFSNWISR